MKIVDVFPYFNEKELLELRISFLINHVDKFIICDANRTHSGGVKEYTVKKTLTELKLTSDKIHVVEVDLSQYDSDLTPLGNWRREREQRNAAVNFFNKDSVYIVSDCDEIINPNSIQYYVQSAIKYESNIIRIPMVNLCGRADLQVVDNNQVPRINSAGFICLPIHTITNTLSELRELYTLTSGNQRNAWLTDNGKIIPAGWHFSWMGDTNRLITKYQSFMHCADYIEGAVYTYSDQEINEFITAYNPDVGSTDPLGRFDHILVKYHLSQLPDIIFTLPRVKNYLLPDKMQTIDSILKSNPLLPTDKNTICFTQYRSEWMYSNYCHSYFDNFYEKEFAKYQNRPINFCEIGIDTGATFFIWHQYFHKKSNILGIDISTTRLDSRYHDNKFDNVSYLIKDAYNPAFVNLLTNFDIIIDDGPHTLESQLSCIELYLPKLNEQGILIIEDVPSLACVERLMQAVPVNYRSNTEVVDLTAIDNRFDSILFVIRK